MQLSHLKRLGDTVFELPPEGAMRVPVVIYGDAGLVGEMDEKVAVQARNVATLPGIVGASYVMPDGHWGYGFPIGGVAAFDPDAGGVVSAGGVGFDIACGVRCLTTGLTAADLEGHAEAVADALFHRIPAGVGSTGRLTLDDAGMRAMLEGGAAWAVAEGHGTGRDLTFTEEGGRMAGADPDAVSPRALERQRREMGTLGSGDHYLEVQVVDQVLDAEAAAAFGLVEGEVVVSLHCGSRGLGHQNRHRLPPGDGARGPRPWPDPPRPGARLRAPGLKLGRRYLGAMRAGVNCALANRQILTDLTRQVFADLFPAARLELVYDVAHNTCREEVHWVGGGEKRLFVHRKGATRAFGPGHPDVPEAYRGVGQPVLIGGSMGTASWVMAGTTDALRLSFGSACHGAGRAMSRHQALKTWRGQDVVDQLAARGNPDQERHPPGRRRGGPGRLQGRGPRGRRDPPRRPGSEGGAPVSPDLHQGVRAMAKRRRRITNAEVGAALRELSQYLEMDEVAFKPRAFEKAAYAVEAEGQPVQARYADGGAKALEAIPSVGEGIAERIAELLTRGEIADLEAYRKRWPVDLAALTRVEGVGPKTVRTLHEALGIRTLDDLARAVAAEEVRGVPGFGAKSEQKIQDGLELARAAAGRTPLGQVLEQAGAIEQRLAQVKGVARAEVAGSIRRRRETVGDMDILVCAADPGPVTEAFATMPEVVHVHGRGETKTSVRLGRGLDCDLRVVPAESFGAALQYFTGSKAHNVALRKRAQKRGWKLSEYGLFEGSTRLAGRTEAEIYQKLGLAWVPPELREDRGELEAAEHDALPRLIEPGDLEGDLQVHTTWTDGSASVEKMAQAARDLGRTYLVITDHTRDLTMVGGLDEAGLRRQIAEIRKVDARLDGIRVLAGAEVNIREDGSLDVDDEVLAELDVVGAAIHSHFRQGRAEMTRRIVKALENPHVDLLLHPTARDLRHRRPVDLDLEAVIEAALKTGTILEIDAQPDRLDLPDEAVRQAVAAGCLVAIDSDAHAPEELRYPEVFGIPVARRGWATPDDVVNTLALEDLLAALKGGGRRRRARNKRGKRQGGRVEAHR